MEANASNVLSLKENSAFKTAGKRGWETRRRTKRQAVLWRTKRRAVLFTHVGVVEGRARVQRSAPGVTKRLVDSHLPPGSVAKAMRGESENERKKETDMVETDKKNENVCEREKIKERVREREKRQVKRSTPQTYNSRVGTCCV